MMNNATENPIEIDVAQLLEADDQQTLQLVADYYYRHLLADQDMNHYLVSKKLDNPELIQHFRLGYANRTLGLQLPQKVLKAGKTIRTRLAKLGLYRGTGREHLNGSLVVPVCDEQGNIVQLYGRKVLAGRLRKGTPLELYSHESPSGVFNLEAFPHHQEIILCSNFLDALTFWALGFHNVTTTYTDGVIHQDLLDAFRQFRTGRVIVAYPRFADSEVHIESIAKQLAEYGIDAFQVLFAKDMTANQYCQRTENEVERFGELVRRASWLDQGRLSVITEDELDALEKLKKPLTHSDHVALVEQADLDSITPEDLEAPSPAKAQTALEHTVEPDVAIPADQASVVPRAPEEPQVEVLDHEIRIPLGDRFYRVRGFDIKGNLAHMKINLMVKRDRDDIFFCDKFDLYSQKARANFIHMACGELCIKDEIIRRDLGRVLITLEKLQENYHSQLNKLDDSKELTSDEHAEALTLLRDPNLFDRILSDFNVAGVVGEDSNKLMGYLACTSRKSPKPLAVIVQSSSAAGKSSLMEAILAFMPDEERVQYSAMTGQSLYYFQTNSLKHKILAIAEEEGVDRVSYALKLLQSESEITIASTGKDVNSGNLITQSYTVEGPIQLFLTTTSISVDEELMNRCIVLTVDESREQTEQIHAAQRHRRTLKGLEAKLQRDTIVQLHQNAQRLIKPLKVVNPYAEQLHFMSHGVRTRRDHEKYLNLIDAIAMLYQYQRDLQTIEVNGDDIVYIEVTPDDIAAANRLARDVLGRTLDELPPQTRKLLNLICDHVDTECQRQGIDRKNYRFTRKTIRDHTAWSNSVLKIHMKRLEDMEYLLVLRGGRGQSFEYELLYDRALDTGHQYLHGLADLETFDCDAKWSGQNDNRSGSSSGQVSPKSGAEISPEASDTVVFGASGQGDPENAVPAKLENPDSDAPYPHIPEVAASNQRVE